MTGECIDPQTIIAIEVRGYKSPGILHFQITRNSSAAIGKRVPQLPTLRSS